METADAATTTTTTTTTTTAFPLPPPLTYPMVEGFIDMGTLFNQPPHNSSMTVKGSRR